MHISVEGFHSEVKDLLFMHFSNILLQHIFQLQSHFVLRLNITLSKQTSHSHLLLQPAHPHFVDLSGTSEVTQVSALQGHLRGTYLVRLQSKIEHRVSRYVAQGLRAMYLNTFEEVNTTPHDEEQYNMSSTRFHYIRLHCTGAQCTRSHCTG
jgi:hypothetical protein